VSASAFRQILEAGDVEGCRRFWREIAAHLPQPDSHERAEIVMHMARTAMRSMPFKHRAYSHSWLVERGHPSQLPDALRPAADKIYPKVVEAVGVSVNFSCPHLAPAAAEIEGAMNEAIEDCFANGEKDPAFVRQRMHDARDKAMKSLFGRIGDGKAV
jgi:hypothetical protein